jgi:hypothetical protein
VNLDDGVCSLGWQNTHKNGREMDDVPRYDSTAFFQGRAVLKSTCLIKKACGGQLLAAIVGTKYEKVAQRDKSKRRKPWRKISDDSFSLSGGAFSPSESLRPPLEKNRKKFFLLTLTPREKVARNGCGMRKSFCPCRMFHCKKEKLYFPCQRSRLKLMKVARP